MSSGEALLFDVGRHPASPPSPADDAVRHGVQRGIHRARREVDDLGALLRRLTAAGESTFDRQAHGLLVDAHADSLRNFALLRQLADVLGPPSAAEGIEHRHTQGAQGDPQRLVSAVTLAIGREGVAEQPAGRSVA